MAPLAIKTALVVVRPQDWKYLGQETPQAPEPQSPPRPKKESVVFQRVIKQIFSKL